MSLYDDATTTPSQWAILADGPFNPRQLPALPLTLPGRAAVGDIPGGDRSHPKEVFYRTGRLEGTWAVRYQAFDLQPGEVELWVNWQPVAALDPTAAGAWATTRRLPIPPELLHAGRPNYIQLVSASTYPSWSTWGVRAVSLVQTARASRPGAGEADVVLGQ